jgi:hypothetical protein
MQPCRLYPNDVVEPLLDFGLQPLTNRFLLNARAHEDVFPLQLGVSRRNGVVQQLQPANPADVRARYSWIKYNEAEDHLDHLAAGIAAVAPAADSRVVGLTYKDTTLIERLRRLGYSDSRTLEIRSDLQCNEENAGLETIQRIVTPLWARSHVARHGLADIVLARHVFEHTHNPKDFWAALDLLLKPGGLAVLEVPDSSTFLGSLDYTMPWEEHIFYFTPKTFVAALADSPFESLGLTTYPYALENSLVAIMRKPIGPKQPGADMPEFSEERSVALRYAAEFASIRESLNAYLRHYRAQRGKIAMLGAGHSACMFINLLGLGDVIDFVVDDSPTKQGLFFPGSRKPIKPSNALIADNIKLCLLSVNHNTEDKVVARNEAFVHGGGEFKSIFRTSHRQLL